MRYTIPIIVLIGFICVGRWSYSTNDINAISDDEHALSDSPNIIAPVVVFDSNYNQIIYGQDADLVTFQRKEEMDIIDVPIKYEGLNSFSVKLQKDIKKNPDKFDHADTILVLSDIEGKFSAFVSFLQGNGVIDDKLDWLYNDNHVALLGDFMDRGDEVFQCLWLMYKLEYQAAASGGNIHFILGNHEILNIRLWVDNKDMSYVHPSYIDQATRLGLPYKYWMSPWSVLGQWLRSKNCAVVIDNQLFVHGGLSLEMTESQWSISDINNINRGLMSKPMSLFNKAEHLIYGKNGPYWYRGLADEKLSGIEINKLLSTYNLKRIILGHTINHDDQINPLYEGRIIPIDLNHHNNYKSGLIRGLLIANGDLYQVDNKKNAKLLL